MDKNKEFSSKMFLIYFVDYPLQTLETLCVVENILVHWLVALLKSNVGTFLISTTHSPVIMNPSVTNLSKENVLLAAKHEIKVSCYATTKH